jgi:PAS domain S-box-containing protein
MAPDDRPAAGPDRDAQAKLRAAFELSPTILCITGLEDGRVRDVNESFERATGFTREETLGRTITELGLWVDARQREAGLRELRAGRPIRDVEARFRTKGGDERVTVLAAAVLTLDGTPCILTALTDITDRTRAEAALRESERRFVLAFHANPLPMTITRLRDGVHVEVNAAAVAHSGFTREEMLGRTKSELGFWVAPAERDRMLELLHRDGQVHDFEVTFRTRRGEQRQLLANSAVITYAGEPAVLSVSLDITERSQHEAEGAARREAAEAANRAKDEFLATLSHELRNPLGTITSAVAALERLADGDAVRRLLAIVARQTGHLSRLVDDLLDVGRASSGKITLRLEPLDLHDVASRCLDALGQAGRTAEHHVALTGEAVRVQGDAARLEQVVANLVDNALKYTPSGGQVTVRVGREGDAAVLRVCDDGQGIRPALLGRVFDAFVQEPQDLDRARGGLGLGLALVRRLVELHGGAVAAFSAGPGRGSEFVVRLRVLAD